MTAPSNRDQIFEREEVVQRLAHLEEASYAEEASQADPDTTIQALKAELDTLLEDIRRPTSDAGFAQESACGRVSELVKALGRDPSFTSTNLEDDAVRPKIQIQALGQYRLLYKLGEGGMGAVYKALHTKLNKVVALKVLAAERLKDSAAVQRFEREMQAVGGLDHPNIVRAMDAGEIDGNHYLVMELVDGQDLSRIGRQQAQLAVADACELIRQAALGLQEAHEHGMVHRDIKPSNLMLAKVARGKKPPKVKILDMGLALLDEAHSVQQRELTGTGQLMGTLDYMAPEQGVDSHEVDIRADIYSLGATLYKLLCGQAPFPSSRYDTPVKMVMALATEQAESIATKRDDLPAELVAIVDRMVAREPSERFATPQQVAEALAEFTDGADLAGLLEQASVSDQPAVDQSFATIHEHVSSKSPEPAPTADRETAAPPWRNVRRSQIAAIAVALGGFALLGIITLLFQSEHGTIVVQIDDPEGLVEVKVVGQDNVINDRERDGEPIRIRPGKHQLHVSRGDLNFTTDEFTIEQDQQLVLRVNFSSGQVQVDQAGRGIIGRSVPGPESGLLPPNFAIEPSGGDKVSAIAVERNFALMPMGERQTGARVATLPSFLRQNEPLTIEMTVLTRSVIRGKQHRLLWSFAGDLELKQFQDCLTFWRNNRDGSPKIERIDFEGIPIGRHLQVAAVSTGKELRLFVDGKLVGSHVLKKPLPTDNPPSGIAPLGNLDAPYYPFDGTIDEIRISNVARYDRDYVPNARLETDENTLALYHIDEGTGNTLKDSSGNGHDLTFANAKWISTEIPARD